MVALFLAVMQVSCRVQLFFRWLAGVLVVLVLSSMLAFHTMPVLKREKPFILPVFQGQHFSEILNRMHASQHFRFLRLFRLGMTMTHSANKVQIGAYTITPKTTYASLRHAMVFGFGHLSKVTVVEGATFHDVVRKLEQQADLSHTWVGLNDEAIFKRIAPNNPRPYEGQLYPATYTYVPGADDITVLQQAHQRFLKAMRTLTRCQSDLPYKAGYDQVIVASLIQKESAYPEEYPTIASVIVNRLRKKMRLQIDAALLYKPEAIRTSSWINRHLKTPFNVYRFHGLPPTAIAIPSMAALRAACQPKHTDYLYYVANAKGHHTFTKHFDAHLKAKRAYKQFLNEKRP